MAMNVYVKEILRGELTCLEITHPHFSAVITLQGAQLLEFTPINDTNWLWLSELAEYKTGQSVRGGIPICWPWFGNAAMNIDSVKSNINDIEHAPAHGFARAQLWQVANIMEGSEQIEITLTLPNAHNSHWAAHLQNKAPLKVQVEFKFTKQSLTVHLITQNNHNQPITLASALHTYFPTSDIHATFIDGFNHQPYIDTLDNWKTKIQNGAIEFTSETDRIYYGKHPLTLITPQHRTILKTTGSNSAVVWNPWIEKSTRLSQFDLDAWQRMFCVETANALEDAVTLQMGESHTLSLHLHR